MTSMSDDLLDDGPEKTPQVEVAEILPSGYLCPELESKLLALWNKDPDNPPGLKELTQALFSHECDGRSAEGRAVKKTLAKHSIRAASTFDGKDGGATASIELSEAHKLFIANNAKTMSSLEMAKTIFQNPALTPLHAECRAVQEYLKFLQPVVAFTPGAVQDVPTAAYQPPKNQAEALERVNHYINFCLDSGKLTPPQKKNLSVLIGYLHTYRFVAQMNNYVDRKSVV